jgi:hypothetical protein
MDMLPRDCPLCTIAPMCSPRQRPARDFNLAMDFARLARPGVSPVRVWRCSLCSVWLEGAERYHKLFADRPPTIVAQFCERVPMVKGRWDPDASTATSYAWFVWSG